MSLHTLNEVYGGAAQQQTKRYRQAIENFEAIFGEEENLRFFSAPGRSEVCGNHTDHNCGKVMAAGVSLDVIAVVVPTDDNIILVKSEGFEADNVSLDDLSVCEEEKNTSASLIRGVAAGFERNGFKIGGFKAYTTSNVLKGSGLSSSAAFEVLIGSILNGLYNGGAVDDVKIAQIAQFAENEYFGKPSGLMDQMASSVGSFITIDFEDTANPAIEAIDVDFTKYGYSLCIVDTKGSHADLTPEYAAIPKEMKSVAKLFGKTTLREITKTQLLQKIDKVREACGDRAVLRALHFFDDNKRVVKEAQALKDGDINTFLSLVNESGNSSYCYLQNIFACSQPENQGLSLALCLAEKYLRDKKAAFRVHGGGFAGTIQAFVPDSKLDEFTNAMENLFGDGSCYVLSVRGIGGTEVAVDDE